MSAAVTAAAAALRCQPEGATATSTAAASKCRFHLPTTGIGVAAADSAAICLSNLLAQLFLKTAH